MKTTKRILAFCLVLVMAFSACIIVSAAEKATALKLNATTIKWIPGKSGSFKPTVTPSTASKTLKWTSSNPTVATVSSAGKLTAKALGTTTITCTTTDGSNLKATCKVTVGKAVTSVKLNATRISWPAGKSGSFKPTVSPSDAINKSLTWTSSNTKVATVSSAGKLTAVASGTATITCKAKDGSGKYATCLVTVKGGTPLATSLKLNATKINWTVGKSGSFKPTVTPSTASKTLKWTSSDNSVATVSSSGKLTAVSAGKATITCATTDGSNLKATCLVTVTGGTPLATALKLNATKINWTVGKSGSFKPTVTPSTASKTLEWTSSDPKVATVSSTGKLTAVSSGKATITCKTTDGSNLKATCLVTVRQLVKSITLDKDYIERGFGGTFTLFPTINPSDADNKELEWTSSDESIAIVEIYEHAIGTVARVTAKNKAGTATITCKATDGSGKYASCTVRVIEVEAEPTAVESVRLNTSTITWAPGKSGSFKATVLPSDATNKTLEWTSSDESVATVSSAGKLTAVAPGEATITCKATDGSGKYATCKVTVIKPVESVSLSAYNISLFKGKTTTLSAAVKPSDAYNTNVSWTSSNTNVVTVSSNGVVTAKGSGTATITCKATDGSGKYATCKVQVGSRLTGLALNVSTLTWEKGKSGSFKPVFTPSDAITTLSWESLNPTVATVDGNGKLTAKNAGTATIVCKTADGTNKTAYCFVLVTDSNKPSANYDKYFKNYFSDGTYTITGDYIAVSEGEEYESKISYGVNKITTNMCIDVNIAIFSVKMITNSDGMFMVIPLTQSYTMIDDEDTTNLKLFDNLIYKGKTNEKIDGTSYTVESFSPYGSDALTVQFCFNSAGTLKVIRQIKADGAEIYIRNAKVSGAYDEDNFSVPDGYKNMEDSGDEGYGDLFG